jgi:tRNA pseudouridine13 synthase
MSSNECTAATVKSAPHAEDPDDVDPSTGSAELSLPPPTSPSNMSSPEDDIESRLGITEYLSGSSSTPSASSARQGFIGVVKARYSDFVVHEVSVDGKIARLTYTTLPPDQNQKDEDTPSILPPSESNNDGERKQSNKITKEKDEDEDVDPKSILKSKQEELSQLIKDETVAARVFTMLESNGEVSKAFVRDKEDSNTIATAGAGSATATPEKFVTLPTLEKSERKSVHEWVRSALPDQARADTLDGQIRIWHIKFEKEMPNYQKFYNSNDNNRKGGNRNSSTSNRQSHKRMRKEWPSDRPDFLQFVLYKENMDTTTATKEVNRRGSTGRIGYAGMKDKRGITTQFCTLYRTTPDQIITSSNTTKRNNNPCGGGGNTKERGVSVVQVGNFEYVDRELRLGMLNGNRFDIVVRNVTTLDEHVVDNRSSEEIQKRRRAVLEASAKAVKAKGFINYFGTQVRIFVMELIDDVTSTCFCLSIATHPNLIVASVLFVHDVDLLKSISDSGNSTIHIW